MAVDTMRACALPIDGSQIVSVSPLGSNLIDPREKSLLDSSIFDHIDSIVELIDKDTVWVIPYKVL